MPAPVFAKLNLKDQGSVVVVDASPEFEEALATLDGVEVHRSFPSEGGASFAMGFGTTLDQVEAFAGDAAAGTTGDAVVWFAYPKGSSKKYRCQFNRDTGWAAFGAAGFEPVRQVAVDEDWSALRFRRVEYIKNLTRAASGALTDAARRRTTGQNR